ncbi:sigma-54 interaction domain-containing protein [Crassaminicella profunda]|uniref:sigma-54 interaction domain-containing protein n=1 Tax=Crassaminicella profunda TaxID=1286698 RepID=UPI001CA7998A|nr:sigma 54-interacting transcriptional regulator [Crassaminicella profunda]QZY54410.1 sigma 54-interacting transcriptional regulator [Crassaminicella profunda]
MKKRKISLLTIDEKIANFFINELNNIFNNMLEIDYYNPRFHQTPYIYETDLILYTDPSILIAMMSYIKCNAPILMMKRTISKVALDKIKKIPPNTKCLVANINSFMANETLATIYQLGMDHVSLHPFYKGLKTIPDDIDYIIAHEPYEFLPNINAEVIIIGNRVFDISTVLDIIALLNIDSLTSENIIMEYSFKVPTFWQGIKYTLENKKILSSQWNILLNELSIGVIVADENNKITLANSQVYHILGIQKNIFENTCISQVAEKYPQLKIILSEDEIDNDLFIYKNQKLILTLKKVTFNNSYHGKIILISTYNNVIKVQQKIHQKIIGKGYFSKYTFSSIIGENESLLECKQLCKKVADSNPTILLIGESGTGKELFAGSIHNYSSRKKEPFVAINCATLPESLLESELFGYEEGSFTGAKKGGKIGLFEIADKGTLFLDEIGEIPLRLQARLLRVLQEKEIMRVGGDSIIKVDTRIIAATNKNLLKMVEDGTFRKDLFFRLNVFQFDIPSLRERVDDIPLLIEYFMCHHGTKRIIHKDFKIFYKNYSWPGNVRELFNVLEYMLKISDKDLSFNLLPRYLKKQEYIDKKIPSIGLKLSHIFLLKILELRNAHEINAGRRSLCKEYCKSYYKVSELEIRTKLDELANEEYLVVNKGLKGCQITQKGINLLKENHL